MTPLLKYKIQPVLLGGTPRAYSHVMNSPAGTGAKEVAGWVDKGLIKDIPIDSRFDMEDAVKVSSGSFIPLLHVFSFPKSMADPKLPRHLKNWLPNAQRARSLSRSINGQAQQSGH